MFLTSIHWQMHFVHLFHSFRVFFFKWQIFTRNATKHGLRSTTSHLSRGKRLKISFHLIASHFSHFPQIYFIFSVFFIFFNSQNKCWWFQKMRASTIFWFHSFCRWMFVWFGVHIYASWQLTVVNSIFCRWIL